MLRLAALGLVLLAGSLSAGEKAVEERTRADRQDLRARQTTLPRARVNAGEDKLDAIDRRAQTQPEAARRMLQIYEADQRLSEDKARTQKR